MHVTDLIPWYIWVLWGSFGGIITLVGAIKEKNIPFTLRICLILTAAFLIICVALDNLHRGLGLFAEYMWIKKFGTPLMFAMFLFLCIGGHQKMKQDKISSEKRREVYLQMGLAIVSIIFLVFLLGWESILKWVEAFPL
jgi:hypothetical protein